MLYDTENSLSNYELWGYPKPEGFNYNRIKQKQQQQKKTKPSYSLKIEEHLTV